MHNMLLYIESAQIYVNSFLHEGAPTACEHGAIG